MICQHPDLRRRDARRLSAAIDRAIVQAEAGDEAGDVEIARAWRRVVLELERQIPEARP